MRHLQTRSALFSLHVPCTPTISFCFVSFHFVSCSSVSFPSLSFDFLAFSFCLFFIFFSSQHTNHVAWCALHLGPAWQLAFSSNATPLSVDTVLLSWGLSTAVGVLAMDAAKAWLTLFDEFCQSAAATLPMQMSHPPRLGPLCIHSMHICLYSTYTGFSTVTQMVTQKGCLQGARTLQCRCTTYSEATTLTFKALAACVTHGAQTPY